MWTSALSPLRSLHISPIETTRSQLLCLRPTCMKSSDVLENYIWSGFRLSPPVVSGDQKPPQVTGGKSEEAANSDCQLQSLSLFQYTAGRQARWAEPEDRSCGSRQMSPRRDVSATCMTALCHRVDVHVGYCVRGKTKYICMSRARLQYI